MLLNVCCLGLAALSFFDGGAAVSWGLAHHGHETTPTVSAAAADLLAKYDGLYVGDTSQRQVYFTFDLGYEAGYTPAVLDLLQQYNIKATFFLCGNYLKETDIIARMENEGHQIGNHTVKHRDLPKLAPAAIREELAGFGRPAKFFRPPEGRFDEKTLRVAKDLGLRAVLWSLAIVDWQKTPIDPQASADKVLSRIHPGAIMLFHITNAGTPEMLKILIPALQERGYSFGVLA